MNNIAIKVSHLTKVYKLYDKPIDRLKESLHPLKKQYHKDFYALNDVSFEIKKGETVGIIGKNGAGKSTLLKIITGVLTPSSGHVHTNGRISSLLELGAGFNPEYTGIENIYLQGTLMGYSHSDMESKIDEILAFAEIGDFVHQAVKMYSSGMFARLAFAVAINVEPDILIVDEALSVGDMKFQQKCFLRMKRLREKNTTILLVTHDINSIRTFADNSLWIESGEMKMFDIGETVANAYISYMTYNKSKIEIDSIEQEKVLEKNDWNSVNSQDYEIQDGATILGANIEIVDPLKVKRNVDKYNGDEKIIYKLKVKFEKYVESLMIGIAIVDKKGIVISHLNTMLYDNSAVEINENEEYIFSFEFLLPNLSKGYYSFYTNIVDGNYSLNTSLAMVNGICGFEVFPSKYIFSELNGIVYLKNTFYSANKIN